LIDRFGTVIQCPKIVVVRCAETDDITNFAGAVAFARKSGKDITRIVVPNAKNRISTSIAVLVPELRQPE
jgi:preprotein translocase subunit SecE